MLKQRIITAVILAICFLSALFLMDIEYFSWFIGAVVVIAAWEWADLSGFKGQPLRLVYAGVMAGLIVWLANYLDVDSVLFTATHSLPGTAGIVTGTSENIKELLMIACGFWAVALLWVQGYPSSAVLWGHTAVRAVMGVFVLLPTWLSVVFLRAQPEGEWLILLMVVVVACADTGAYFTGMAYGKRKLAPAVSPGKSWEGFWGGFASCAVLALLVGWWQGDLLVTLAIILPVALVSVLGDLLESMVKRHRGIKDSSQLLPGHGGFLDRVDSITAAAPVFALAVILSGWHL